MQYFAMWMGAKQTARFFVPTTKFCVHKCKLLMHPKVGDAAFFSKKKTKKKEETAASLLSPTLNTPWYQTVAINLPLLSCHCLGLLYLYDYNHQLHR